MKAATLRWVYAGLAVILLLAFAVPSASAAFVPKHSFSASIEATVFGNETEQNPFDRLGFLTGGMTWGADARGVFVFSDAGTFRGLQIDRVEVVNVTAWQSGNLRTLPRNEIFDLASLSASPGSSLFMVPDDVGIAYSCQADFALSTFLRLPDELFEVLEPSPGTTNGSHMASSGQDQTCDLQQTGPTASTFIRLLNNESSIVVSAANREPQNFTGTDWAFQLRGTPVYEARADGILTPFKGTASALLKTYGGTDVNERFTLAPLQRMLSHLMADGEDIQEGNGEAGEDPLSALRDIAPVLDGVVLGNLSGPVRVDGEEFKAGGWSFIRFDRLEVAAVAGDASVAISGESRLIAVDGDVYETRSAVELGPLHIPTLSILLWLVAAGAIVASIFLKPLVGASEVKNFGLIRLLGFIFHILAMVAAFILFDLEVKAVLGTSLLTLLLVGGGAQGMALGLVAFFQLLPFALAAVFFGLPMRFIANSALRFGGLRGAKGFGKGVGNLATWGLGAIFLRVLLGGFLGLALDLMSGITAGG